MASQCLSTDDLCLLTNNLPNRVKFFCVSPPWQTLFWIPACAGMTTGCGEGMTICCGADRAIDGEGKSL